MTAELDLDAHDNGAPRAGGAASDVGSEGQTRRWIQRLAVPTILVLLGVAAMTVDLPLAHWFADRNLPDGLRKACNLAEVFGHGVGITAIFVTVWVLSPGVRLKLPRAVAAACLAGLVALSFKLLVVRTRPKRAILEELTSIADTFQGWLPGFSAGFPFQSFPSGHTAAAVGLAMSLTWLFPRGKWLFTFFVVMVALQRIISGDHFLSDTLWGAAVGWLCAAACLPGGLLSPVFDGLERKLASRPGPVA